MKGKTALHVVAVLIVMSLCHTLEAQEDCYMKVHRFKADRGRTKDLSSLNNGDCAPIAGIDSTVLAFMEAHHIVGASLAVSRGDSLLYVKGYGYADREHNEMMQPWHTMRVASVSKLITAVGIMMLQDEKKLSVSDKVFSPEGPLGKEAYTASITDPRMLDITIEHLLRHEGGFDASVTDPLFTIGSIDCRAIVEKEISGQLAFDPGSKAEYSNVGYYILGMVIEKVGGMNYVDWIQENLFQRCQCHGFRIGGNYPEDRMPEEVRYYMYPNAEKEEDFHGDGRMCEACYGSNNVTGVGAAGAWTASAPELSRFIAGIDNDWNIRDIISEKSILQMTEFTEPDKYALGWISVDEDAVWTRTGSFAGTTAIVRYYSKDGDCWIFLTNTGTTHHSKIAKFTSAMIGEMRTKYSSELANRDLFYD